MFIVRRSSSEAKKEVYQGRNRGRWGKTAVLLVLIFTLSTIAYAFPQASVPWVQQAKLIASDAEVDDWFGRSVSVDRDTVVVGGQVDNIAVSSNTESAYVFVQNGSSWSEQSILTANDAAEDDEFGNSVAVDGDTVIIGAREDDDDGEDSGSAYVFIRNGSSWIQQAKLTASDAKAYDWFGTSVAVDGDTAVIGANNGGSNSGVAYVFVRNGSNWSQQAKLIADDIDERDSFGRSVAVSGDTAVIGSPFDDDDGASSGSAYVFVRNGNRWNQQAKLTANDARARDVFGYSVVVSGGTAVIGSIHDDDDGTSSGSAYVFVRDGILWDQQAKLTASDAAASDSFGWSVAVSGNTAVIGSPFDDDDGASSGSAYVFVRNGNRWDQQAKLIAGDPGEKEYFGYSVEVDGDTVVIGVGADDFDGSNDTGSAYIFSTTHLSIDDVSLYEGDSGITNLNFTITRTNNDGDISVDYATDDGAATNTHADYIIDSGVVIFAAGGALTKQVAIQVNGDANVESDETFFVNLSNAVGNAVIVDGQGEGIIVNDDVAGVSIAESGGDTAVTENGTTDTIDIQLTSQPEENVEVILSTGNQLQLSSSSLTFTADNWDDVQSVTVTAVDDPNIEGNHSASLSFSVQSSDANYSNLIFPDVAISITDNDKFLIFLPLITNP